MRNERVSIAPLVLLLLHFFLAKHKRRLRAMAQVVGSSASYYNIEFQLKKKVVLFELCIFHIQRDIFPGSNTVTLGVSCHFFFQDRDGDPIAFFSGI